MTKATPRPWETQIETNLVSIIGPYSEQPIGKTGWVMPGYTVVIDLVNMYFKRKRRCEKCSGVLVAENEQTTSAPANAELIVRAVNSHDALVAVSQRIADSMTSGDECDMCFKPVTDCGSYCPIGQTRAALTLAKSGKIAEPAENTTGSQSTGESTSHESP